MQTSHLGFALLGALLLPPAGNAQAVAGVGDDARVLPRGALSIRTGNEWSRSFERYGKNSPGRKDGTLEPLGLDFNFDSLGTGQLESLSLVEAGVRALAGMPDFGASLGKMVVHLRDHTVTIPLGLELGLTNRFTLGLMVPFVTATSEVDFRVNPSGREPTLGFNPIFGTPMAAAVNAQLLAQFDSAAAQLTLRLAFCVANPGAPGCSTLNANASAAQGLIQSANAFASGLGQLYGGRPGSNGSLFIPITGTAAQAAIEARVAAYRALYATFGSNAITSAGPLAAQAPFTESDAQLLFTNPTFGIRAQRFGTTVTRGIGDIDVTAKLKLVDTFGSSVTASYAPTGFNWRQSIGGLYRLATGALNAPDNFTDLGTGLHERALGIRSFTDLMFGKHFWMSLVARYNVPLADERVIRITASPDEPLAAAFRQQRVRRKLGNEFDIAINPRWTLNDYVGLAGHYYYRRKFSDGYTGTFGVSNLAGQPVTIDASALNFATEAREHRLGGGVSFSTIAAYERGKASLPVEISYFHYQTTLGSGGDVPKLAVDQMQVRIYGRFFGR